MFFVEGLRDVEVRVRGGASVLARISGTRFAHAQRECQIVGTERESAGLTSAVPAIPAPVSPLRRTTELPSPESVALRPGA
jgi:hypothetical protein